MKSNVGHLLTGAGAAGLMKVLLALQSGELPPSANFASAGVSLASSVIACQEACSSSLPWGPADSGKRVGSPRGGSSPKIDSYSSA